MEIIDNKFLTSCIYFLNSSMLIKTIIIIIIIIKCLYCTITIKITMASRRSSALTVALQPNLKSRWEVRKGKKSK